MKVRIANNVGCERHHKCSGHVDYLTCLNRSNTVVSLSEVSRRRVRAEEQNEDFAAVPVWLVYFPGIPELDQAETSTWWLRHRTQS